MWTWSRFLEAEEGGAGFSDGIGTSASYNSPEGVAVGKSGTIYVYDIFNYQLRKIDPVTGQTSTFAGSGQIGSLDGPASLASFMGPRQIALDSLENVYLADWSGHAIRKVTPAGFVSTVAGNGTAGYADGIGTLAQFNSPFGICIDSQDMIYVADNANYRIRKISSLAVVTTFAGSGAIGSVDGYGTSATFGSPTGMAIDKNGFLYVSAQFPRKIRKVSPTGYVTTIMGSTASSQDGYSVFATTNEPRGICIDGFLNIYFTEWVTGLLRRIDPNGIVTTIAGSTLGIADGAGTNAQFSNLGQITIDPTTSDLIIGDRGNNRIRRVVLCSSSSQFDSASTSRSCLCSTSANLAPTENCKCPLGYEFNVGKTACVLCIAGEFKSSLSQSSCSDCPIGTESASNRQSCTNCSAGKYRPNLSNQICVDCPLYATCNTTSMTACQPGFKINAAGNALLDRNQAQISYRASHAPLARHTDPL